MEPQHLHKQKENVFINADLAWVKAKHHGPDAGETQDGGKWQEYGEGEMKPVWWSDKPTTADSYGPKSGTQKPESSQEHQAMASITK